MKSLALALALLVVAACGANAEAGEPNLKALGAGSMKKMSQPQAKQVRGQGAIVWGGSYAIVPGAASTNGYIAAGRYVAGGVNFSKAGSGFGGGEVRFRPSRYVFAGGGSFAFGF